MNTIRITLVKKNFYLDQFCSLYISTAKNVNVLDTEREWISGWKYLENIKCVLYSALNT
jgi:hypothetical protein